MAPDRTEVHINPSDIRIDHQAKILMLGSCFTEYIGEHLEQLKFDVDINPFGILYNPLSVHKSLEILLEGKAYTRNDLFHHNGLWLSFDHHSRFSDPDPDTCLDKINNRLGKSMAHLRKTDVLVLTFGTAWSYVLEGTSRIVSNCHKLPAGNFDRFHLNPNQVFDYYYALIATLLENNPKLRIILTVSPVRHWKDGPVENTLSKSVLIISIHRLVEHFRAVEYFPAFEIAIDDLRDYRYYADDLVHPNNQMINYIWDKFSQAYFRPDTMQVIADLEKIVIARKHKAFQPESDEHQKFLKSQIEKIRSLKEKYPFLDLDEEEHSFKKALLK